MKKKLLALLLALAMVLGAAPAFAADDGETTVQVTSAQTETLPFTVFAGETELTDVAVRENAYVPYAWNGTDMAPSTPVKLYTVTVPEGTSEVTLNFEENRLVYNYLNGSTYLAGEYEDPYTGANNAAVKIDCNEDGVADYIQVQTPYDPETWASENLYAVTFAAPGLKAPVPFVDLTDDWYRDGVGYVYNNGLMRGIADGYFAPKAELTRAEVVTVIGRLAGETLEGTGAEWYAEAMAWAKENGILLDTDASLDPLEVISREELALLLYRYLQSKGEGFTGLWAYNLSESVSDADEISEGALEAVSYFYMKQWLIGKDDGRFDPNGTLRRSELATILARMGAQA